jgi:ArsR family transcriptional regulator
MEQLTQIFKALGDETRLEIVRMLLGRELCVCDILAAFAVSQSTISHHLKILKQAGLLIDRRDGKWIYYSIHVEVIKVAKGFLQTVIAKSATKARCQPCADITLNNRKMGREPGDE